jgi:hypothetical protein
MPKSLDLNALASNAQREIERGQRQVGALLHKPQRHYGWISGLGVFLVVVFFAMSISDTHTKRFWLGVSEQKQIVEMTATLTAARLAVDSAHTTTGEWPKQVPLPALAALVELQSPGPDYRLITRTSKTQLSMTPIGEIQRTAL